MKESGYYPPGAEFDVNAPYNQREPELKEVTTKGEVSVSLYHEDIPLTVEAREIVEKDYDEDGNYINIYNDYSDSKPEKAYEESPLCITQLLHEYADVLKGYRDIALSKFESTFTRIKLLKESDYCTSDKKKELLNVLDKESRTRKKVLDELNQKIAACEGWVIDDINVCLE